MLVTLIFTVIAQQFFIDFPKVTTRALSTVSILHQQNIQSASSSSDPEYAVATATQLKVLDESGKVLATSSAMATLIQWSPDKKRIAFLDSERGIVVANANLENPIIVPDSKDANSISWGKNNWLYFAIPTKGIYAHVSGDKTEVISPIGLSPVLSPNGTSLAFCTTGENGGVWISNPKGEGARKILKSSACTSVSWSFDSRWLAVASESNLSILKSNGKSIKKLGSISHPTVAWSSGTAALIAKRNTSWHLWDFNKDEWTDTTLSSTDIPQWTGPNRLLTIQEKSLWMYSNNRASKMQLNQSEEYLDELITMHKIVGIYVGKSFPDVFVSAPKPTGTEVAKRGKILSADPVNESIRVAVESETTAFGQELVYANPKETKILVTKPDLMRRLSLLPETNVRVIIDRNTAVSALIEDEVYSSQPDIFGNPNRIKRNLISAEYDGITREKVIIPIIYPFFGKHTFVDTFLADRDGGDRRHHGNDLMAKKMRPLLAVFDGIITFSRSNRLEASNNLLLQSDDGWEASYIHINNDTPGTDDGKGSMRFAYPADLQSGDRVKAGEVIAWCGDSGNAESTAPHLHFELYDADGRATVNPAYSLRTAKRLVEPVYINPDPTFQPLKSETRWDGVVVSTNLQKRTIVIELTGIGKGELPPKRNLTPQYAYIQIPEGTLLKFRSDSNLMYPLDYVRAGMYISAAGLMDSGKLKTRIASFSMISHRN
jgi:hypothetical protein